MSRKKKKVITNSFFAGFGLLVILLLSGGLFFINEIKILSKLTHSIYHHPLVVSNTSLQCSLIIEKMHKSMMNIGTSKTHSDISDVLKSINRNEKKVYEKLSLIQDKILGEQGKNLVEEAIILFQEWKPIRDQMIETVSNNQARKNPVMQKKACAAHVAKMELKMLGLNDYARTKASVFLAKSDEAGLKIKNMSYAFLIISLVFFIIIGGVTLAVSLKGENALIQSEHQHRVIFENSPLGIIRFSSDGSIADFNEKIIELMGSSKEKLLGFDALGLSAPKMTMAIKKALDGNASVYEDQYTSVTGNKTTDLRVMFNPVHPGEKVTEVIATFEDVSERKKTQRELQENESRLQKIFKFVQTGIMLIDRISHEILDVNPAAALMIQAAPELIIGKNCYGFICPANKGECPITDLGQAMENSEQNLITKNGKKVPVLKTVIEVSIKGRACLLACFVDISQQKEIENALIKAKEAAEEAARSKADFLANMSHEIRTPMNGVIGMTELLSGTDLNLEQQDYLNIIKFSGESLLNIINDILDYSKIEAGRVELEKIDFNLRSVLEGVADLSAIKVQEKGLEYCTILHPKVPTYLTGDPGRLRQILINLIGNAAKFTEKGEIVISVRLEKETSTHVVIYFGITDTGIGIPEDKKNVLFESFSQVDASTTRKYGGTGLGLSISKQLSHLMGGKIGVDSKEQKGSCFWFTAEFEKQQEDRQKLPVIRQDIKGKHILIVDDNRTNRFVLKEDFKLWGCRFDEASNGTIALEKLISAVDKKDPFEIAIIDMQMPKMDGEELGQKIKQNTRIKDTILIMLTSMGMRGDAKRLTKAGFSAYLKKPVKQSSLLDCLAMIHHVDDAALKKDSTRMITIHSIAESQAPELKILLAEDNLINQKVALGALRKLGFMADVVINGKEAVQAVEMKHYDLVLMDCQMPEMDGYEATIEIRNAVSSAMNSDVPIIAMTANAMAEDRKKCLEVGMNDYLAKPVKIKNLLNMIQKWLPNKNV